MVNHAPIRNFGYCCINLTNPHFKVGHGLQQKGFLADTGLVRTQTAILNNLDSLAKIVEWNWENDIKLYRMSSGMFPWPTHWNWNDLPDTQLVFDRLDAIGDRIRKTGLRVSFHPGPFCVLASTNPNTVDSTIRELEHHGEVMDLMGLDESRHWPINIHVNLAKGDKSLIREAWIRGFGRLSKGVQSRIVLENDDKPNQWNVNDLLPIWQQTGVSITYDVFHDRCQTWWNREFDLETHRDTATKNWNTAVMTWEPGMALFHHASWRGIEDPNESSKTAHADWIWDHPFHWVHRDGLLSVPVDFDLECKAKDLALINFINCFKDLNETRIEPEATHPIGSA
jgi:UV DNA damage endonuclease